MSKMDNLRAMREARYAEAQKRAKSGAASAPARRAPVAPPPKPAGKVAAKPAEGEAAVESAAAAEELCGHRNMSGRTCTRERGHAAKSHRYS